MANTKDKVSDAASNVKPYVERAVSDPELRENVKAAFQSAREIYDELKAAVDELRTAANRVQGKKQHGGRNATLLIGGIALGILFNPVTGPATRKWLADTVFGGDDFTYENSDGDSSSNGPSSTAA